MKFLRSAVEIFKGWIYLAAFVTGGNFVRKANLKRLGHGSKIAPTAFLKFPEQIQIGENSFVNHLCCVWAAPHGSITIGNDVLMGPGTCIIASNHGTSLSMPIRMQPGRDADIFIGNDVWLGAHVTVTAGVRIGDGCVVGAGAVVTRSLPANTICAGVPARPIRPRTL